MIPWLYFLQEEEQLLLEAFTRKWVVNGPATVVTRPFWQATRRDGLMLSPTSYVRVRDNLSGAEKNVYGPQLYFMEAHEELLATLEAIPLKINEYVRIMDQKSGKVRVVRGESTVYLEPAESLLGGVTEGVNLDEETAVLVRNIDSGQLRLVTEKQVFFPAADEEIEDVQRKIKLEDKEAVIIRDKEGKYQFRYGWEDERAFFLQPYSRLVHLYWSTGLHKNKRDLKLTKLDLRPKFMWFEFDARTKDNVELIIGITFFWEVADLQQMIKRTDDAPGDICSHARSAILQAVSQRPLEQFLAQFNLLISEAVLGGDIQFYEDRGLKLHAVEARSVACKDPATQRVLQEIINETTNRINRLQKQESENEVKIKHLQGEIAAAAMREDLLALERQQAQLEGETTGEREAARINSFFAGIADGLDVAQKLELFTILRKQEALAKLSDGTAQLYFTPQDVNLTIEGGRL